MNGFVFFMNYVRGNSTPPCAVKTERALFCVAVPVDRGIMRDRPVFVLCQRRFHLARLKRKGGVIQVRLYTLARSSLRQSCLCAEMYFTSR